MSSAFGKENSQYHGNLDGLLGGDKHRLDILNCWRVVVGLSTNVLAFGLLLHRTRYWGGILCSLPDDIWHQHSQCIRLEVGFIASLYWAGSYGRLVRLFSFELVSVSIRPNQLLDRYKH